MKQTSYLNAPDNSGWKNISIASFAIPNIFGAPSRTLKTIPLELGFVTNQATGRLAVPGFGNTALIGSKGLGTMELTMRHFLDGPRLLGPRASLTGTAGVSPAAEREALGA